MGAKGNRPDQIPQPTINIPKYGNDRGRSRGDNTGFKKGIDDTSKKNTDHFRRINLIREKQGLPPVKAQPTEPVDDGMTFIPYQGEGTVEGYGSGLNAPSGTMFTMQFTDKDGDGKDDRFQKGPSTKFNARQYLDNYTDLQKAFGDKEDYKKAAREHYLQYGIKEGRVDTAGGFNAGQYLANYPDLQKAFGTDRAAALKHYKEYGIKEGRTDKNLSANTKIEPPKGTIPPDKSPEARQAFLDSLSKEELEQRAHRDVRKILPRDPKTGNPIPPRRHQGIQKQVEEANSPKTSQPVRVASPTGNTQVDKPSLPDEDSAQKIRAKNELLAKAEVMKQKRSMEEESIRREQESIGEEQRMRDNEAGEINVSRNIDIGEEQKPLDARPEGNITGREEQRDFTRQRSLLEGGRRGRSREEREAFRDRYISTLS